MTDRLINAMIIATLVILALFLGVIAGNTCTGKSCPGHNPQPAPTPSITLQSAQAGPLPVHEDRPPAPTWSCRDKLARILKDAGFRGHDHRQAWAIVMRESRGQNLIPGHPQFNGEDWGIWQINAPAWSGERWWSYEHMSIPEDQSRIVYKHLSKKGKYWRPWGLTEDGQLDATHYQSWGPDLWEAWIMAPYRHFYAKYPCRSTPK